MSKWAKKHRDSGSIPQIVVQVMIQNLFFFFRGVGSLSQPRLNIFTVGNMRVMICLGQGGLRSLSASSYSCNQTTLCTLYDTLTVSAQDTQLLIKFPYPQISIIYARLVIIILTFGIRIAQLTTISSKPAWS